MPQTSVVATGAGIDYSYCALRIGQQMVIEGVVHVALTAHQRHFVHAPLMESVIALIAVESCEEQSATALAERQREECLPNELVRDVSGKPDVQNADKHLLAIQHAHIGVPVDRVIAVGRRYLTDVTGKVTSLESFGECIFQPHSGDHLDRCSLLIW